MSTLSQIVISQLNSQRKRFWNNISVIFSHTQSGLPGLKVSPDLAKLPKMNPTDLTNHGSEAYDITSDAPVRGTATRASNWASLLRWIIQRRMRHTDTGVLALYGSNRHFAIIFSQFSWLWLNKAGLSMKCGCEWKWKVNGRSAFFSTVWLGQRQCSSCQICPVWDNKLVMGQDTGKLFWKGGKLSRFTWCPG